MKVGDRLYCYCVNNGYYHIGFGIDSIYVITYIDDYILYIGDYSFYICLNRRIFNDICFNDIWLYSNWFYTEKEYRKLKLNKLGRC